MSPTPTPELAASSDGLMSGFASMTELLPVLLVVVAAIITIAFSQRAYRCVLNASSVFAASVEYAIKGVVTAIFIGIIALPIYLLGQTTPSQRSLVAMAVGVIIVGYAGLVVLGIIGDRIWANVVARHQEATGHAPFENWGQEADD